jgi:uncharacterized protein YlxW (UPF0749 family)
MKMRKRGELAVVVVCAVVGFLLTAQLRTVRQTAATDDTSAARLETLQKLYNESLDKNEGLEQQLTQLQNELAAYREQAGSAGSAEEALKNEIEALEVSAGLTDLEGPGVTVVMTDSTAVNVTGDEADYIIHDSDIMSVINELRSAGAEAISLNGERIMATSEIRCTGAVVTVNGRRHAAPYVIMAIGDSATLYNALTMRNGVVDVLGQWGITVKVTANDQLFLPKYDGAIEFRYAHTALPEQEVEGGE